MPVYVIGHRNPDTDSICSAIAYAHLLRQTHLPDAVAACCGEVNPRTQFVLSRAGVEPPRLVMDVRPTLGPRYSAPGRTRPSSRSTGACRRTGCTPCRCWTAPAS
jgi:hypothetical protein